MDTDLQTKEAIRCTWIGGVVDALLGLAKIIVGTLFHSAALIADGIHSLSDLFTDFMVIIIMKVSRSEPDRDHPYGHERFETLGTVALGLVLVAVAGAMAYDSILSFKHSDSALLPGWPALVVAMLSIIAKEVIFRWTFAVGKRIKSDLIIANAWHSRTDAYSSIIVLVGVAGAMAGVHWLDTLAAVLVAAFVAKIGWGLCWKSLKELVDTAIEPELANDIRAKVMSVEGIEDVHSFKSRQMGPKILIEMHLQVRPYVSASEGHFIGDAVVTEILRNFDDIGHVIFHIDAEDDVEPTVCPLLPFRTEVTTIIDDLLEQLSPELGRQQIQLHYLHNKIEIDLMVARKPESTAKQVFDQKILSEQLNEKLAEHNWFQHLNLWLAI